MTEPPDIGHLEPIAIRSVWADEARDLTPWLASRPDLIGEALGMDLELEGSEVSVGPFSADLLFRTADGMAVVVENMVNATDHDHLGKLITYGAGLDAGCAVLVAESFRPEHRSALEWLNRHSSDQVSFFGIALEVWRIGDSAPAPRLDVVVQPDEWARVVRAKTGGLTSTQELYRKFWQEFLTAFHRRFPGWSNARTPMKARWTDFPSAGKGVHYSANYNKRLGYPTFGVELYVDTGDDLSTEELFDKLSAFVDKEQPNIPLTLVPERLEGRRASRIATYYPSSTEINDEADWPAIRSWALDALETLRKTFEPALVEL